MNMLGENLQTVKENTEILMKASKNIGLEVNSEKKKRNIWSYPAIKMQYKIKI